MAVLQISRIQVRRGKKNSGTGIPQLSSGEFGWAVDTQELYIGNGSVSEGSPNVGNTRVLTENDFDTLVQSVFDTILQSNPGESITQFYQYRPTALDLETGLLGPTVRPLQSKLDDIVSAKAFGVTPNGETDVTGALQLALDQLYLNSTYRDGPNDSTWKVILTLEPGIYLLSGVLEIPPFATIRGAGIDKTVIRQTGEGAMSITTINDNTEVDKSLTTTTYSNQPRFIELSNLTIENLGNDVCLELNAVRDSLFENVKFKGNTRLLEEISGETKLWVNTEYPGFPDNGLPGNFSVSSDNGSIIVSSNLEPESTSGFIWISQNFGETWTKITQPGQRRWSSFACSSDGSKIVTAEYDGNIWTSADSGTTWVEQTAPGAKPWSDIACSSDGSIIYAIESNGLCYKSNDSGVTWEVTDATASSCRCVACSADGSIVLAGGSLTNNLYLSTNGGTSWTIPLTSNDFISVAMDSAGNNMVAVEVVGDVFVSNNGGLTWTNKTNDPQTNYYNSFVSNDGSTMIVNYTGVYFSYDYGATWHLDQYGPYNFISANKSDGKRILGRGEQSWVIYYGTLPSSLGPRTVEEGVGINLKAKSSLVTCDNNIFKNCKFENLQFPVNSDYDIQNNVFVNCTFKDLETGIRFGVNSNGTTGQEYGPRNNKILNSSFTNINQIGINIVKGTGNISQSNTFKSVGNDGGPNPLNLYPIINFSESGNISTNDYFDRSVELGSSNLYLNYPYVSEISGMVMSDIKFNHTLTVEFQENPTPLFRLPGDVSAIYLVHYSYISSVAGIVRQGTLKVVADLSSYPAHILTSEEFDVTGILDNATNLMLEGSHQDTDLDSADDTVVISYTNSTVDDSGTFHYWFEIIS